MQKSEIIGYKILFAGIKKEPEMNYRLYKIFISD